MSPEQVAGVEALAAAIEGQNLYHGRYGTTPAGLTTALAIRSGLLNAGWQLTRVGDEERLRAAATEWHNALRNGRLYNGSCACARRTGEMCSLGAALAPQPPSPASQGEKR